MEKSKKPCKNNNFKIFATAWKKIDLPDGSYSESDI